MGATVFSGIILGLCALLMFGIGIFQVKSKKPVGFYSGVKAPDKKELSDVNAWNKKHGAMWIIYGLCIVLAWVCELFIGDGLLLLIPYLICLLLPIPFMALYHHKLIKKYYIK
ncbi:MAG: hypothetical protein KBT46_08875 [Ruminococcus sp.]|nr:hypothetical protein [Candidatus Copronaster equi]